MEHGYPIPVYFAESCPQNKADWNIRSRQLNCSNDDTKIHRYHCVPNGQKTALLEFCYDVIRPLVQKDNCMELAQSGTLNQHSCTNFLSGCPETHYYSDESYLYPNCSRIDFNGKCYVADPSCESSSTTFASVTETIASTGMCLSENLMCTHLKSTLTIVSTILSLLIMLSCLTNIAILKRKAMQEKYRIWKKGRSKQGAKNIEEESMEKMLQIEDSFTEGKGASNMEEKSTKKDIMLQHLEDSFTEGKEKDIENVHVGKNRYALQCVSVRTRKKDPEKWKEDDLEPEEKEKTKKMIGASIELGTTNSGCCYSLYEEFSSDPVGSISLPKWNSSMFETLRTGTEILLDKNLKCTAFGYDAEIEYMENVADNIQEFYFFSKFIKQLTDHFQKDKIATKYILRDVHKQKEFDAIEIVAKAIEYMMDKIFKDIEKRRGYKTEDVKIYWVLTVSSLWNNKGKQFLCDCATKAGISRQSLLIVTEADALEMYSRYSGIWKSKTKDVLRCGTKVMVLDIGGSVMNVTIYEIDFNGSLKLLKVNSIPIGGSNVDIKFQELFSIIVGEEKLGEYRNKFTSDYLEIFRAFESKKRTARPGDTAIRMKIPITFIEFCKKHDRNLNEYLKNKFGNSVRCFGDNFKIERPEFEHLFKDTVEEIVKRAEGIYEVESDTKSILIVGGFSNSYILQKSMVKAFSEKCSILFEDSPEVAVLRGSVLYSHQPHVYQMVEEGIIK